MGLFIGGASTNPEIEKLKIKIPIKAGMSISQAEVARILGLEIEANRFRTVVNRWRHLIWKDHSLRVVSEDRIFLFLSADEASKRGRRDLRQIGRATGRLYQRVEGIADNDLSPGLRDGHQLLKREVHGVLDSARRAAKAIAPPRSIQSDRVVVSEAEVVQLKTKER